MFTVNKVKLLNYLISFIPLSIILGNLIVNLNVVIICIFGMMSYGKKIFSIENKNYQYLIYSFFTYLIITTFFNNISSFEENYAYKENIFKSIFFFRFLILFLVVNYVIQKNELDFKLFYISCSVFSFLLAFDIIFQVFNKKNLLGFEITNNRPSGFFGGENIAGGYLQKFILFFIFLFSLNQKIIKKNLSIFILLNVFIIPIIFTGNRMSTLIYFFTILLYLIMQKKLTQIFIVIMFFSLIIFLLVKFPIITRIDSQIKSFKRSSIEIIVKSPELFLNNKIINGDYKGAGTGYLIHFNTGIQIWKQNKIFGHGLKSFPLNCSYEPNQTCNTHPHNYLIEIMVDTGVIGVILIYLIFFIAFFKFCKFYLSTNNYNTKQILLPFFFIIFFEFFPIRSSGSFFTTNNATIIFLFLSFFINFKKIYFLETKKEKK